MNVVASCHKLGVKKLVYASSSSVFGDPVKTPMDESHPTNPNNPYGASKLAGEKYCTSFAKAYGMDVTCLRYFSVYGPRGRPDQVLYAFAKKAANGEPPTVYGDGSYLRDFTYISDIVSATILAVYRDSVGGSVLNIGCGKDYRIVDVARKIIGHYGGGFEPRFVEQYEGDFPRTLCDNSLARTRLGWRPAVPIDEGLSLFLFWFDSRSVPLLKR